MSKFESFKRFIERKNKRDKPKIDANNDFFKEILGKPIKTKKQKNGK